MIFADDTSLFSVVHDVNSSAKVLNDDLKKVNDWAFQWTMFFNPDPSKQAQEVIFSHKSKRSTHPSPVFNNNYVFQTFSQKQVGFRLDFKLTFEDHLTSKALNSKFIIKDKTNYYIYKAFIRSHLDYNDILYDPITISYNSFKEKL